ncbi:MAG: hypothetical protein ACI4V7_08750 [Succinivibrionaceae bacterium]
MIRLDNIKAILVAVGDGKADVVLQDEECSNEFLQNKHSIALRFLNVIDEVCVITKEHTDVSLNNDVMEFKIHLPTSVVNSLACSGRDKFAIEFLESETGKKIRTIDDIKVFGTLTILQDFNKETEFVNLSKKEDKHSVQITESINNETEEIFQNKSDDVVNSLNTQISATDTTTTVVPKKNNKGIILGLLIGIIILLLLIISLVGFFLFRTQHVNSTSQINLSPCNLSAHKEMSDADMLSKCLATNPTEEELITLVKDSITEERCDLSKRIMIGKARTGMEKMAKLYGDYLNPNMPQNSCIKKNKEEAIYWYKKVANDKDVDDALELLK